MAFHLLSLLLLGLLCPLLVDFVHQSPVIGSHQQHIDDEQHHRQYAVPVHPLHHGVVLFDGLSRDGRGLGVLGPDHINIVNVLADEHEGKEGEDDDLRGQYPLEDGLPVWL